MHVVWLTTIFDDSAVSNILLQILPQFPKNIRLSVVSLEKSNQKVGINTQPRAQQDLIRIAKHCDARIEHTSLQCKRTAIFSMIHKFRKLIRTLQPTIIHAQLGRAYIVSILAHMRTIPCIATFHNNPSYFNKLTYFFLKCYFSRFTSISAVSQSALKLVKERFDPHDRIPAQTIYNPIRSVSPNISTNQSRKTSPTQDTIYKILVVGRLIKTKRHDLWIQMLPFLEHLLEQEKSKLILSCVGVGKHKKTLQQQSIQNNTSHLIRWIGYSSDVLSLIQEADLVLVTSENEGFGLVPCESLLAGTPVVIHAIPVMREIIKNTIWLVNCFDPREFSEKCKSMLLNKKYYLPFIAQEQQHIQTQFSRASIAKAYCQWYSELSNEQ